MEELFLCESEKRLMEIIWEEEPLESGKLVKIANEKIDWNKSTTYTILRKLIAKGFVKNEDTIVSALIPKEKVLISESNQIVEDSFSELADMIDMTLSNDAEPFLTKRSQVFLTGGGIALMRGAREALAAKISRPVKVSAAKSSKLNSPVFSASLGLADLVFDSIEHQDAQEERLGSRLKNLFGGRGSK